MLRLIVAILFLLPVSAYALSAGTIIGWGGGSGGSSEDSGVINVMDPPYGSGLTAPVADGVLDVTDPWDGTDGNGGTGANETDGSNATDDSGAINAAIVYACGNDYHTVHIPEGVYRIGDRSYTTSTMYHGINISPVDCPNGIRLTGDGIGKTILAANSRAGMYIISIIDTRVSDSVIRRDGVNAFGHYDSGNKTNPIMDGFTTATPAVISFTEEALLEDGDRIYMSNCGGNTVMNDRYYYLDACTGTPNWDCALVDKSGQSVEGIGTWTAPTCTGGANAGIVCEEAAACPGGTCTGLGDPICIANRIHDDFVVEIDNMWLTDDDPRSHFAAVAGCSPCLDTDPSSEEAHGILVEASGGKMIFHDLRLGPIGDEAIDFKGAMTSLDAYNLDIFDAPQGAIAITAGRGIVVRNSKFTVDSPTDNDLVDQGATGRVFAGGSPYINLDTGGYSASIDGVNIHDNLITGGGRVLFQAITSAVGISGQSISNVNIHDNLDLHAPRDGHCDEPTETCASVILTANDELPITNVTIKNNIMSGLVVTRGAATDAITISDNVITPIDTEVQGASLGTARISFVRNSMSGFEHSTITYAPYDTDDVLVLFDSADVTNATDDVTLVGHGYSDDDGPIQLTTDDTLPSGLSLATDYWIEYIDEDTFGFRASPGAAAEAMADDGTGNHISTSSHTTVTADISYNLINSSAMTDASNHAAIGPVNQTVYDEPHKNDEGYLKIVGNTIVLGAAGYTAYGIDVNGRTKNTVISNNSVLVEQGSTTTYGIGISADDSQVTGNTVTGDTIGIKARRSITNDLALSGLVVSGNTLRGYGEGAVVGLELQRNQSFAITNNNISNYGSSGMYLTSTDGIDSTNGVISGNTASHVKHGVRTKETSGGGIFSTLSIIGNTFDVIDGVTNDAGIDIDQTYNSVISNNSINVAGIYGYGIVVRDSSGNSMVGNSIVGASHASSEGIISTGTSDSNFASGNIVEGGGEVKMGSTAGTGCAAGGANSGSLCDDNLIY